MEFTALDFWLITLFNTVVCLAFPRLISLNWQNVFSKAVEKIRKPYEPKVKAMQESYTQT